ncbi:hypothetical protein D5086_028203 [Populus alba]|uniref:Uncharacterized protein n=1 Tax=Populus alba TaxID=43335 RepID=A0ACC4AXH1_POPAL
MRRRPAEYRRPVRRRLSQWIWALIGMFLIAGLVLFVFIHNHHEDQVNQPIMGEHAIKHGGFNFTKEILNASSFSRQLAEQMTLAKAYVIIAKEHNNLHLAWELSKKIRSCQLLLSKAAMRGEPITVEEAEPIISSLSYLIFKAQDAHYDIATTMMTMKSHIQALEERTNAATVQSTLFGQLVAEVLPKSLHCLKVKLINDWLKQLPLQNHAEEKRNSPRVVDNNLYHFCIFSDNILATSVILHQDSRAYYFGADQDMKVEPKLRSPEYLSLLNHLRFYIPEIYPLLEKIVFLDDDVVVQKDLTRLFSLDLHGNVNGAVETCLETFHRYYKYINFSNPIISSKFDPQACGWAFGMNIFDLIAWRKENVTAQYHYWQEQNADQTLWKLGTLPPALLAFYGLTEPLDRRWHVLGLGYDMNIDDRLIDSAAVIHFNGNMKPWLKLAISRYKPLWERYVNQSHPYYQDCVIS